jgi:hypothetical protein
VREPGNLRSKGKDKDIVATMRMRYSHLILTGLLTIAGVVILALLFGGR